MNLYNIFQDLEKYADKDKAKHMAGYMKDKFQFLGIQTPKRKEVSQPYFKEAKKTKSIDWDFVDACWEKPYREAHYLSIDYINMMKDFLLLEDLEKIKRLITSKSWWDSVDGFHRLVGYLALKYPEIDKTMIQWSLDKNIWLRRIAIDHQMHRKEEMKEELLEEILVNNLGQGEFFINKAIGWALRDYSKTNPEWVREFVDKHRDGLSNLSIREGTKYI